MSQRETSMGYTDAAAATVSKQGVPLPCHPTLLAVNRHLQGARHYMLVPWWVRCGGTVAVVAFLSLLQGAEELSHVAAITGKYSVLNQVLVKQGLAWTMLAVLSLLMSLAPLSPAPASLLGRAFARAFLLCVLFLSAIAVFSYIEQSTGLCLRKGVVVSRRNKRQCLKASLVFYTFDISGHVFLMTYCVQTLMWEARAMRRYINLGKVYAREDKQQLQQMSEGSHETQMYENVDRETQMYAKVDRTNLNREESNSSSCIVESQTCTKSSSCIVESQSCPKLECEETGSLFPDMEKQSQIRNDLSLPEMCGNSDGRETESLTPHVEFQTVTDSDGEDGDESSSVLDQYFEGGELNRCSISSEEAQKFRKTYMYMWPVVCVCYTCVCVLCVIWDVVMVITTVYYHSMMEKLVAVVLAVSSWVILYTKVFPMLNIA